MAAGANVAGYFGSDQQQALQLKSEQTHAWAMSTPGAVNSGRLMGTDDPDLLGWDRIFSSLEQDGVFAFRLMPADRAGSIRERLAEKGYRIDTWDVFLADRIGAEAAVSHVLGGPLPNGFRMILDPPGADSSDMADLQAFVASNGVAPFSGSMLAGEFGPTVLIRIVDQAGNLAAAAHGYLPHNRHSRHHRSAWGGMVAVSPDHRGSGLGRYANALMVRECFASLGAETVHEFVSTTNVPSRRMVEASGLRHDPGLLGGIAVPAAGERFTR